MIPFLIHLYLLFSKIANNSCMYSWNSSIMLFRTVTSKGSSTQRLDTEGFQTGQETTKYRTKIISLVRFGLMWCQDLKIKIKEHFIDIVVKQNWPQIEEYSVSAVRAIFRLETSKENHSGRMGRQLQEIPLFNFFFFSMNWKDFFFYFTWNNKNNCKMVLKTLAEIWKGWSGNRRKREE